MWMLQVYWPALSSGAFALFHLSVFERLGYDISAIVHDSGDSCLILAEVVTFKDSTTP